MKGFLSSKKKKKNTELPTCVKAVACSHSNLVAAIILLKLSNQNTQKHIFVKFRYWRVLIVLYRHGFIGSIKVSIPLDNIFSI